MNPFPEQTLSAPVERATERALDKLLFRKLMPLLIIVYVISFLDRTNIALAKASIAVDLGISSAAYGLGAGLFFLTYAALEVPSNLIMYKCGAKFWIARIMVTWGLLSAGMAFVQGETSFYVMRLLLGAAEAGLFPGVMLYLTYWFDRKQRVRATGYFLLGVCVANILSGPLGGALLQMQGVLGMHGWQWLFICEGLPAAALAIVVWKHLPNGPASASWLTSDEVREIERRLAADQREEEAAGVNNHRLRQMLADRQIWLAIAVYFCHQISIYTLIFFLPSVIGTYGKLSPLQVGTLNSVPWIAAAIGAATLPRLATTAARCRRLLVAGLLIMAAGLVIGTSSNPVFGMAGFSLTALMIFVVQSTLFLFPSSRLKGQALAGGLAFVTTCGLFGGFFGPSLMGMVEQATGSIQNGLWMIAALLVAAALAGTALRQGQEGRG
ncbi:Putative tartrate transporter [Paraburkholderia unamae]|uniref:MFS transporter n=1 Tax=Paraburkholderia unamae TaxID=219649 RepID=UPI000DC56F58|nr:MFS transporter [Paraburkholderia unamae]RAR57981.1 sugar phosphate permease [Paraburkholderia unamae]CAG9259943.1 Putative tartrate transporter [Paraburkholderia unamae]